jgi:hypothetical protein
MSKPSIYREDCDCIKCHEYRRDLYKELHGTKDPKYIFELTRNQMVLCPICGNKRCPKATFHINECTNSNEAGQVGSVYE